MAKETFLSMDISAKVKKGNGRKKKGQSASLTAYQTLIKHILEIQSANLKDSATRHCERITLILH